MSNTECFNDNCCDNFMNNPPCKWFCDDEERGFCNNPDNQQKEKHMTVSKRLRQDVLNQCGSIHSMNAPHAIGYIFTVNKDGQSINTGMFVSNRDEINNQQWSMFFCSKNKKFYDLNAPNGVENAINNC